MPRLSRWETLSRPAATLIWSTEAPRRSTDASPEQVGGAERAGGDVNRVGGDGDRVGGGVAELGRKRCLTE